MSGVVQVLLVSKGTRDLEGLLGSGWAFASAAFGLLVLGLAVGDPLELHLGLEALESRLVGDGDAEAVRGVELEAALGHDDDLVAVFAFALAAVSAGQILRLLCGLYVPLVLFVGDGGGGGHFADWGGDGLVRLGAEKAAVIATSEASAADGGGAGALIGSAMVTAGASLVVAVAAAAARASAALVTRAPALVLDESAGLEDVRSLVSLVPGTTKPFG